MCLAIPGRVLSIAGSGLDACGLVRFGAVERTVNLSFTPEARIGDYVIVHVGCAIRVLDQDEAHRSLALLEELQCPEGDDAVS
jgi:hydrogenase expression/formation protein HypC